MAKKTNKVWMIQVWDGLNAVDTIMVNSSFTIRQIAGYAKGLYLSNKTLKKWVKEEVEEHEGYVWGKGICIPTVDIHPKKGEVNLYYFNLIPDITIEKHTVLDKV